MGFWGSYPWNIWESKTVFPAFWSNVTNHEVKWSRAFMSNDVDFNSNSHETMQNNLRSGVLPLPFTVCALCLSASQWGLTRCDPPAIDNRINVKLYIRDGNSSLQGIWHLFTWSFSSLFLCFVTNGVKYRSIVTQGGKPGKGNDMESSRKMGRVSKCASKHIPTRFI